MAKARAAARAARATAKRTERSLTAIAHDQNRGPRMRYQFGSPVRLSGPRAEMPGSYGSSPSKRYSRQIVTGCRPSWEAGAAHHGKSVCPSENRCESATGELKQTNTEAGQLFKLGCRRMTDDTRFPALCERDVEQTRALMSEDEPRRYLKSETAAGAAWAAVFCLCADYWLRRNLRRPRLLACTTSRALAGFDRRPVVCNPARRRAARTLPFCPDPSKKTDNRTRKCLRGL